MSDYFERLPVRLRFRRNGCYMMRWRGYVFKHSYISYVGP